MPLPSECYNSFKLGEWACNTLPTLESAKAQARELFPDVLQSELVQFFVSGWLFAKLHGF